MAETNTLNLSPQTHNSILSPASPIDLASPSSPHELEDNNPLSPASPNDEPPQPSSHHRSSSAPNEFEEYPTVSGYFVSAISSLCSRVGCLYYSSFMAIFHLYQICEVMVYDQLRYHVDGYDGGKYLFPNPVSEQPVDCVLTINITGIISCSLLFLISLVGIMRNEESKNGRLQLLYWVDELKVSTEAVTANWYYRYSLSEFVAV